MSSALSSLRRFDIAPVRTRLACLNTSSEELAPVQEVTPTEAPSRDHVQAQPEALEVSPHPLDESLKHTMEQLVEALNMATEAVGKEIGEAIAHISAALLPELANAGLADEIMCHLPSYITTKSRSVTITCAPQTASKLSVLVEQESSLSGRCTIVGDSLMKPGKAEISWGEGGIIYDLEASLAELVANSACLSL